MTVLEATYDIHDPENAPTTIGYDDTPMCKKSLNDVLSGYTGNAYHAHELTIEHHPDASTMVVENYIALSGIQAVFQILSSSAHVSYNDFIRICVIHGFSIYMDRIGEDIKSNFYKRSEKILAMKSLTCCGVNSNIVIDGAPSSQHSMFRLDFDISGAIAEHARFALIPKYKLITILICYSLSTHSDLLYSLWNETFVRNVDRFESRQKQIFTIL
jgi:hypothetical protein